MQDIQSLLNSVVFTRDTFTVSGNVFTTVNWQPWKIYKYVYRRSFYCEKVNYHRLNPDPLRSADVMKCAKRARVHLMTDVSHLPQ